MFVERVEVMVAPGFIENCYIVSEGKGASHVIVVDPGSQPELILDRLAGRILDCIVLTHGHFDHTGAVIDLVEATGAEVVAHSMEAEMVVDPSIEGPEATRCLIDEIEVDRVVEDGDLIPVGNASLTVLHTPGHTSGSMCLYNEEGHILLAGDTLFYEAVGRTDFPTGSGSAQRGSIKRLFTLPDVTRVYPGHDGDTSIGHEKRFNPLASII